MNTQRADNWRADDAWQKTQRDRFLSPFYLKWADGSRFVYLDKGRMATIVQKRLAADTVATHRGSTWFIEEKLCKKPFPNFFLETESCTVAGHESPGWMTYGEADLLFYCFADQTDDPTCLDCYLIDFQKLKFWFWPRREIWPERTVDYTRNHSRGRIVPRSLVARELRPLRFKIYDRGRFETLREVA